MNISRSVFLVDDDADDQEIFLDALKEVDATLLCHTSDNGLDAIKRLSSGLQPDVIFLDLNLPRLDGKQILRELKRMQSLAATPIIIYSTSNTKEDIEDTIELGANRFITKPSRFDELCDTLRSVFTELKHAARGMC